MKIRIDNILKSTAFAVVLMGYTANGCQVLEPKAQEQIVSYLRELLYVPQNFPAILTQKTEAKNCYEQVVFVAGPPGKATETFLTLSPDMRFLSTAVYDSEELPPGGREQSQAILESFLARHDVPIYGPKTASTTGGGGRRLPR